MNTKQIQNSIEKLVDDIVHRIAVNKSTRLEDPSRFDKEGLEPFMKEFWSDAFKSAVADVVYTEVMAQVGTAAPVEEPEESEDVKESVDPYVTAVAKFLGE